MGIAIFAWRGTYNNAYSPFKDVEDMAEDPGGSTSCSARASGSATDQTKSQVLLLNLYLSNKFTSLKMFFL